MMKYKRIKFAVPFCERIHRREYYTNYTLMEEKSAALQLPSHLFKQPSSTPDLYKLTRQVIMRYTSHVYVYVT